MGIYKNGHNWYIDYYAHGKRKREKIGPSQKLAETVLAKRKVEIAEGRYLDVKAKIKRWRFENFANEYYKFGQIKKLDLPKPAVLTNGIVIKTHHDLITLKREAKAAYNYYKQFAGVNGNTWYNDLGW